MAETYHVADIIAAISEPEVYEMKGASGATEWLDIVVDAERCMESANLTDAQKQIVFLRWKCGFTQQQCSIIRGCSIQAIGDMERAVKRKLQEILTKWGEK